MLKTQTPQFPVILPLCYEFTADHVTHSPKQVSLNVTGCSREMFEVTLTSANGLFESLLVLSKSPNK